MVPDGQEVPQIHKALPAPSTRMSLRLHASCLIAHTPEPPKNKLSVSGLETSRWVDTGRQAVNGCGSVGLAAESSVVAVIQPESGDERGFEKALR